MDIALVTHHPSLGRESRLAYAARKYGYRMHLIMVNPLVFEEVSSDFESVHEVRDEYQALLIIQRTRSHVVHVVTPSGGSDMMLEILRRSDLPTIMDPYDCTEGMMVPAFAASDAAHRIERECFANADHVCSRHLEPLHLRRRLGYHINGTTYFPEYCWGMPRSRPSMDVSDDDELSVVYAGGVLPEDRFDSSEFGYAQYIAIGREFAKQNIHLHIYPSPTPERVHSFASFFELYIQEAENNRFFHIHEPLPIGELQKVLPTYHAALHIFGVGVSVGAARNSEAKIRYSTAAKLFDYIQAGLPVLIHDGFHQLGLVRHYGEPVHITHAKEAREKLTAVLRQRGPRPRRGSTIAHQAHRLMSMYQMVVTGDSDESSHHRRA